MVSLNLTPLGSQLLVVTENGYGKRTPIEDYPTHSRGGGGVITSKVTDKTGAVATARVITEKDNDLMIISAGGVVIRTDVSTIHVAGRATQGVRLMNLGEGDKVVAVATTNGKKLAEPDSDASRETGDEPETGEQNEDTGEIADIEGEEPVEEGEETSEEDVEGEAE